MSGRATIAADALTPAAAVQLQRELSARISREDRFGPVQTVGGIDVAYGKRRGVAHAAAVVLRLLDFAIVDQATAEVAVDFPYIPGLLSFREAPAAVAAFGRLSVVPDLLLVDGQGLAHPRRCGIASHLGLLLDQPTIGVGKSRLIGMFEAPGPEKGDRSPLLDRGESIGWVLRTRHGVKPLFISTGHRVSADSAVSWVLACLTRYRLPEPIRLADRLSRQIDP